MKLTLEELKIIRDDARAKLVAAWDVWVVAEATARAKRAAVEAARAECDAWAVADARAKWVAAEATARVAWAAVEAARAEWDARVAAEAVARAEAEAGE